MSKERFSKLQKWILVEAFKNGEGLGVVQNKRCNPYLYFEEIHYNYFNTPKGKDKLNKHSVSIHRAVKKLLERGWLFYLFNYGRPCGFVIYKDRREALESLLLTWGVNIKEIKDKGLEKRTKKKENK